MGLKKPKELSSYVDPPRPSAEDLAAAKAAGAQIRAFDPRRVQQFLTGQITLGDLEGIGKDDQYKMAKTGFELLTQGRLEDARKVFEGLHALDPYDAYFLTALGSIAHQESKLEEADARYTRALEINPFFAAALANRGEIRLSLGKLGEAIEDFAKAIQEDPEGKDPSVRRARALVDTMKKQLEAEPPPAAVRAPSKSGAKAPAPAAPVGKKLPPAITTPLPSRPPIPGGNTPLPSKIPAGNTPKPARPPGPLGPPGPPGPGGNAPSSDVQPPRAISKRPRPKGKR